MESLGNHVMNDMAFHVCQSHVAAAESIGTAGVIHAYEVKHCCVQVMHLTPIFNSPVTPLVRRAVDRPSLDASTCHPDGIAKLIMVASVFSLCKRGPAEFTSPDDPDVRLIPAQNDRSCRS